MTDKERTISVYVDDTGKYKGISALERVEIKDYIFQSNNEE